MASSCIAVGIFIEITLRLRENWLKSMILIKDVLSCVPIAIANNNLAKGVTNL